jgi:hypothetical protein
VYLRYVFIPGQDVGFSIHFVIFINGSNACGITYQMFNNSFLYPVIRIVTKSDSVRAMQLFLTDSPIELSEAEEVPGMVRPE